MTIQAIEVFGVIKPHPRTVPIRRPPRQSGARTLVEAHVDAAGFAPDVKRVPAWMHMEVDAVSANRAPHARELLGGATGENPTAYLIDRPEPNFILRSNLKADWVGALMARRTEPAVGRSRLRQDHVVAFSALDPLDRNRAPPPPNND